MSGIEITELEENRRENREQAASLEERFESIEGVLSEMENPEVALDRSFELYKKGMEELKAANAMLDEIEKAMLVMAEDGTLEEF